MDWSRKKQAMRKLAQTVEANTKTIEVNGKAVAEMVDLHKTDLNL